MTEEYEVRNNAHREFVSFRLFQGILLAHYIHSELYADELSLSGLTG